MAKLFAFCPSARFEREPVADDLALELDAPLAGPPVEVLELVPGGCEPLGGALA